MTSFIQIRKKPDKVKKKPSHVNLHHDFLGFKSSGKGFFLNLLY